MLDARFPSIHPLVDWYYPFKGGRKSLHSEGLPSNKMLERATTLTHNFQGSSRKGFFLRRVARVLCESDCLCRAGRRNYLPGTERTAREAFWHLSWQLRLSRPSASHGPSRTRHVGANDPSEEGTRYIRCKSRLSLHEDCRNTRNASFWFVQVS